MAVFTPDDADDPRAVPGRPDRPVGVRQVDVRAQALQADRGAVVRLLPGLVSDDENDQSATDDAFAVLHFVAAQRLARGQADGRRCDQRAARGAQAAGRAGREYHVLPVAIVLDLPERVCHERNGHGPIATSARTSSATSGASCTGRCAASGAKASGTCTSSSRRRRSTPPSSSGSRSGTTASTNTGRSTSSATSTAAATSWKAARSSSGYAQERRRRRGPPGRPQGGLRRRPRGPRPAHRRHAQDGDGDVAGRHGAVRARQPRHQAEAEARGPRRHRSPTGWIAVARRARTARPPEFRAEVARVPRRPREPLRARRRAGWSSPTPA